MIAYLARRVLYAIPILLGVNLFTFALFFVANSPDDMARLQLGIKRVTPEAIAIWKHAHGYDKPLFYNGADQGLQRFSDTIFFEKSASMFAFDFGRADDGRDIAREIRMRAGPSLEIALPSFVIGMMTNITFALLMAFFRATLLDMWGVVLCVAAMSISGLFYIIGGQFLVAKLWHWVPISGFESGLSSLKFVILPVAIGVVSGIGGGARWYRTLFLEEIGRDYVRTARSKGISELAVLFRHVARNGLIPILTGAVVIIPSLFIGSLILESFFGIPGLGSYTLDAINSQDFAVVRSMVFIGSLLNILGLMLTDISYTVADPRIRLQ
ncbi:MAG: ABC transporter permease [Burkholderiales bacterium]|nr:ABC transporter permease [Burkholderiales bacterium]